MTENGETPEERAEKSVSVLNERFTELTTYQLE